MSAAYEAELDKVMRRGKRIYCPGFTLYYGPIRLAGKPRIVVSQKVDKRSVVRHKVKRRLRHLLADMRTPRLGIVLLTNKAILDQPFPELAKSVARIKGSLK